MGPSVARTAASLLATHSRALARCAGPGRGQNHRRETSTVHRRRNVVLPFLSLPEPCCAARALQSVWPTATHPAGCVLCPPASLTVPALGPAGCCCSAHPLQETHTKPPERFRKPLRREKVQDPTAADATSQGPAARSCRRCGRGTMSCAPGQEKGEMVRGEGKRRRTRRRSRRKVYSRGGGGGGFIYNQQVTQGR